MIELLVWVAVLAIVVILIWWILTQLPLPDPARKIITHRPGRRRRHHRDRAVAQPRGHGSAAADAMTTYVMRNGRLVQKRHAPPLRGVAVISDAMDIAQASRHRRNHRQQVGIPRRTPARSGCVEVGTETMREQPRYQPSVLEIVHDVKRSIAELRSR